MVNYAGELRLDSYNKMGGDVLAQCFKVRRALLQKGFIFAISLLVVLFSFILRSHAGVVGLVCTYSVFICFLCSGRSILDPRSLFLIMLTVYSVWFPLQVIIFGYEGPLKLNLDILLESIRLQVFGIVVFVLICTTLINEDKVYKLKSGLFRGLALGGKELLSEKIVYWPILFVILISLLATMAGGYTSKREILDSGSVFKVVGELSFYVLLVIVTLHTLRSGRKLVTYKSLIVIFVGLGYFLLLGERDIFFRVSILAVLILVDRKNIPVFLSALFIVFLAIIIVPLSQEFKAVFLSGDISVTKQGLDLVFSNEFISAGRNVYSLMYYGVDHSLSFLFNDVQRAFIPSILMPETDIQSTGAWFDSVYRVTHNFSGTAGWGFTIIGQGYLIAGYWGVFIVMSIIAMVISLLYKRCYKSEYWYVFYLIALTTYIYIIRADFANLLSQVFKIGGLSVLGVYFAHCVFLYLKRNLWVE